MVLEGECTISSGKTCHVLITRKREEVMAYAGLALRQD